ncbi:hypothetical protein PDJAM_G00096370 [Pangasius djambal]|uniref:Uncharacterized protein n=1 Tax=Pangasius djambal TaxID=1691987 RepID=A0ACC5Z6Y7_9TELE|nr:hypothetical protein [Pangasius djambal]
MQLSKLTSQFVCECVVVLDQETCLASQAEGPSTQHALRAPCFPGRPARQGREREEKRRRAAAGLVRALWARCFLAARQTAVAGLQADSGSARGTSELGFTLADVLELRRGETTSGRSVQSLVLLIRTDLVRREVG